MAYAKTSQRAERRALREKMRAMGIDYREIAAEFARRYNFRPRAAWREAHGWSLKEAAGRINTHTGETGIDPTGIAGMTGAHLCEYEQWPRYGDKPAGRRPTPYLLSLLAAIYGCQITELIDLNDRQHLPPADLLILDTYSQSRNRPDAYTAPETASCPPHSPSASASRADRGDPYSINGLREQDVRQYLAATGSLSSRDVAYRWFQKLVLNGSWIGREVVATAHEGSSHAEKAEQRDIGDSTLDQMRADVARLSAESMTGEPFPLLREMRRVRDRIIAALERRLWPRDATELYLLLGCLSDLMAVAAAGLGYPQSAEELIRAGWAYAVAIDHRPLMAHLRLQLASISYWSNRPRQARDLAASGLTYLSDGPNAAHLHVKYARAAARLGDADDARRAITAANEARERERSDEVLAMGGEFGLSLATQHYFAGSALTVLDDAQPEAAAELEQAVSLYAAGPGPSEQHWFGGKALAGIDLAAVWLRTGQFDAAIASLDPVLSLPAGQRITALTGQLAQVRTELAKPRYQGSPQARSLDERIEGFASETIVRELHELPLGPG